MCVHAFEGTRVRNGKIAAMFTRGTDQLTSLRDNDAIVIYELPLLAETTQETTQETNTCKEKVQEKDAQQEPKGLRQLSYSSRVSPILQVCSVAWKTPILISVPTVKKTDTITSVQLYLEVIRRMTSSKNNEQVLCKNMDIRLVQQKTNTAIPIALASTQTFTKKDFRNAHVQVTFNYDPNVLSQVYFLRHALESKGYRIQQLNDALFITQAEQGGSSDTVYYRAKASPNRPKIVGNTTTTVDRWVNNGTWGMNLNGRHTAVNALLALWVGSSLGEWLKGLPEGLKQVLEDNTCQIEGDNNKNNNKKNKEETYWCLPPTEKHSMYSETVASYDLSNQTTLNQLIGEMEQAEQVYWKCPSCSATTGKKHCNKTGCRSGVPYRSGVLY